MAADFSITDAATSGVRLFLRKPKVYAYWTGFNLLAMAIYLGVMAVLFGQPLGEILDTVVQGRELDSALFLPLLPRMALAFLTLFPAGMFYSGVVRAAATRAMTAPDDDRNGYLRFGVAELRVAVVVLALAIISVVVQLVVAIVFAIPSAIVGGVSGDSIGGQMASVMLQSISSIATSVASGYVWLRLALAPAQTLDQGKIYILESWSLTKGRVLSMLVSYIIVWLILMMVFTVVLMITGVAVLALGADLWSLLSEGGEPGAAAVIQALRGAIVPAMVIVGLMTAFFSPIYYALLYCPAADIYRETAMQPPESVF